MLNLSKHDLDEREHSIKKDIKKLVRKEQEQKDIRERTIKNKEPLSTKAINIKILLENNSADTGEFSPELLQAVEVAERDCSVNNSLMAGAERNITRIQEEILCKETELAKIKDALWFVESVDMRNEYNKIMETKVAPLFKKIYTLQIKMCLSAGSFGLDGAKSPFDCADGSIFVPPALPILYARSGCPGDQKPLVGPNNAYLFHFQPQDYWTRSKEIGIPNYLREIGAIEGIETIETDEGKTNE